MKEKKLCGNFPKNFLYFFELFVFVFASCEYGPKEFFFRNDQVNSRSAELLTLDAPNTGGAQKFSALFFTDVHFGRNSKKDNFRHDAEFFEKFSQVFEDCRNSDFAIKFAICTGDVAEHGKESEFFEYKNFCNEIEEKFNLKVYSVLGNHDLYNSGFSKWKKNIFPHSSFYFFETLSKNFALSWYFLDTANGTLGKEQLESFRTATKLDKNPKIIFTHYPIYAGSIFYYTLQNIDERDLLLSIFAKTSVRQVVCGHLHENSGRSYLGYFDENCIAGYLDNRTFALIFVDLVTLEISIKYFEF